MFHIIIRLLAAAGLTISATAIYLIANKGLFKDSLPTTSSEIASVIIMGILLVPMYFFLSRFAVTRPEVPAIPKLEELGVATSQDPLPTLCANIRRRAERRRNFANTSVYGIVTVVVMIIIFFFGSSAQYTFREESMPMPAILAENEANPSKEGPTLELRELAKHIKEIDGKIAAISRGVEATSSQQQIIILSVTSTLLRFASVGLAIFLVQILVNFTRYSYRVADHLDSIADAILAGGTNTSTYPGLAELFAPKHIEFGKAPVAAQEKLIDVLKDLASKIASK